ncbi:hypothetical protein DSO57_1026189 [Entomophthora muscae]|uniref:Uncharacterized protein n=1 Tax=Entomophthora muscae TaxID=34485 RepID=A0ACC2RT91_9FUNG|nr:hypothetical protein DSO57_1026189 [Entomophthora muscae]
MCFKQNKKSKIASTPSAPYNQLKFCSKNLSQSPFVSAHPNLQNLEASTGLPALQSYHPQSKGSLPCALVCFWGVLPCPPTDKSELFVRFGPRQLPFVQLFPPLHPKASWLVLGSRSFLLILCSLLGSSVFCPFPLVFRGSLVFLALLLRGLPRPDILLEDPLAQTREPERIN